MLTPRSYPAAKRPLVRRRSRRNSDLRAATRHVPVRDLPLTLRDVLQSVVRYGAKDIAVTPGDEYRLPGGGDDGCRSFAVAVNLATGDYRQYSGDWGGGSPMRRSPVDHDDSAHALPYNFAVILGQECARRVYARITMHPGNFQLELGTGRSLDISEREMSALRMIVGLITRARVEDFPRAGLGAYGPDNAYVASLARKGLVKVTRSGAVSATTEGKNIVTAERGW